MTGDERSTLVAQAATLSTAVLAAVFHAQLDRAMAQVYSHLLSQWWFTHDTFEPALSAACFLIFLTLWYVVDTKLPAFKRWRIQASDDMSHWTVEGHGARELLLYLGPLTLFDCLYPRRAERLTTQPVGFWWLFSEVFASLVVYDMLFWASHLAIHRIPWLYRIVHAKHHRRRTMRARETVALSVADEALDVACSIAALNVLNVHPLSRAVYDVVIVYLLTELHSGYDLPWSAQNVFPTVFAGSKRHTQHHLTGKGFYQKFFLYLDNAFHTAHVGSPLDAHRKKVA